MMDTELPAVNDVDIEDGEVSKILFNYGAFE